MTFSYAEPVNGVYANIKDEVRFLLMDTVVSEFNLSDEEIQFLLVEFDQKPYLAAAQGALHLATAYAQLAAVTQKTVGDLTLSLSYQNTSTEYRAMYKQLKLGKIDNTLSVYNGDTSAMQFTTGQFDDNRY